MRRSRPAQRILVYSCAIREAEVAPRTNRQERGVPAQPSARLKRSQRLPAGLRRERLDSIDRGESSAFLLTLYERRPATRLIGVARWILIVAVFQSLLLAQPKR